MAMCQRLARAARSASEDGRASVLRLKRGYISTAQAGATASNTTRFSPTLGRLGLSPVFSPVRRVQGEKQDKNVSINVGRFYLLYKYIL